jgi:glycosyltransferase involved in cell wall biosynthesis
MKLLICTQAMDKNHPILGFFHRWVEEFAKHCEVVHVICLIEGEHSLPSNVYVHSLGKEHGKNRLRELWRFYRFTWKLRHSYDCVFVHMNQIYVILGAPLWWLRRKKVGLWYMHGTVSISLWWAEKMAYVIFTGSKKSFRLVSKKLVVTGHGIDTDCFRPNDVLKDIDVVTVGRITPSKNIELQLDVLAEVRKKTPVTLTIVGHATTKTEVMYQRTLEAKADVLGIAGSVVWYGSEPNAGLPSLLNRSHVFLHTATNGSLDKAVLEALACGVPVVSSADSTQSITLIAVTSSLLPRQAAAIDKYNYVRKNHSILSLVPTLLNYLR